MVFHHCQKFPKKTLKNQNNHPQFYMSHCQLWTANIREKVFFLLYTHTHIFFRERKKDGEREGEKHLFGLPLARAPTGDQPTSNLLLCRVMPSPVSHTSRVGKVLIATPEQHKLKFKWQPSKKKKIFSMFKIHALPEQYFDIFSKTKIYKWGNLYKSYVTIKTFQSD